MAKLITRESVATLCRDAELSGRRRMHANLHESYADHCQRLLNAICADSYIHPHRHLFTGKPESLLALRGRFALVTFDEEGGVLAVNAFSPADSKFSTDAVICELQPEEWHSVVAVEAGSVLLEVKAGPFDPFRPKELANWAPPEGTDAGQVYLKQLRKEITRRLNSI